ncbi:hypothetical protein DPMN_106384 [Dreissena polymorpha]|uniref:Uncharacterized protein n=1 Tax=Dreissena polymorpha TaxID=45954 RepID=A0A9D4QIF3_DREPO|nr:hypothetical protein DPMN_106384 [Dreissena polymorpha]
MIITGSTEDIHLENIETVLHKLEEYNILTNVNSSREKLSSAVMKLMKMGYTKQKTKSKR